MLDVHFFLRDTATTEIYTLSLHDALPIFLLQYLVERRRVVTQLGKLGYDATDRKSGSAGMPRPISYAVFCLKKKKSHSSLCSLFRRYATLPRSSCGLSLDTWPVVSLLLII